MTDARNPFSDALAAAGISKTIYAYTMPETKQVLDRLLDGGDRLALIESSLKDVFARHAGDPAALARAVDMALAAARAPLHAGYDEAWTQKQDAAHREFFDTWKEWSSPVVKLDGDQFPFMYPIAGASEGLRTTIQSYEACAQQENFTPVVHVFAGEYEGFAAYTAAAGIKVVQHARTDWRQAIKEIGPHDQFYISQPSAIDGNVWPDFDAFAQELAAAQPSAELMLDLTYVGAVAKLFTVTADHPNVAKVFFSLSKPFGVYYHRIAGCLSRREDPQLFGNKWFKNLLSLQLGTALMKAYDVHALPTRYQPQQMQALAQVRAKTGFDLKASDVFLLAAAPASPQPAALERHLTRETGGAPVVRVCLTPTIAKLAAAPANPAPGPL